MNLVPGDSFEQRYEIRSELGGSEFSVVYRATSIDTGRDVVVRVLLPPPEGYPAGFDSRFVAEAKHVAKLKHAGTVKLESFGAARDGVLFLVSEFISGTTLADALAEQPVSAADAVGLIIRMAESLGEAHVRGVIHRELKPENIVVPLRRGVLGAKLRDYGLTKYVEDDGPMSSAALAFGSPRYVSPEQVEGRQAGPPANIYSLGLIFFEMLTGEPCVRATTARDMLSTHLTPDEYEIPSSVPDEVATVLRKMIVKDEGRRYSSTDELIDDLKEIDRGALRNVRGRRVVRSLERADAHGIGEATLIDPVGLDANEIPTQERMKEVRAPRRPSRPEVLTPTNIVAASDVRPPGGSDKTMLSDPPTMEQEPPTDELEKRQKPARQRRVTGSPRPSGGKDDTLVEGDDRPKRRRKKRRTPPPQAQEERVSPLVAGGAIVLAVLLALGFVWGYMQMRDSGDDGVRVRQALQSNPLARQQPAIVDSIPELPSPSPDVGVIVPSNPNDPITGCGVERTAGWTKASEVVGLTEAEHWVYVPNSYDGTPAPAILIAHPPGSIRGRSFADSTHLSILAQNLGAILVVPVSSSLRPWLDDAIATEQEFDRVLNHATENYCIDQTQVFGIGMSTGGVALDAFSCAHPGRLAALALVSSWVQPSGVCPMPDPAGRFYINGLKDRVSPYNGGGGCYGAEVRLPMKDVLAKVSSAAKCEGEETYFESDLGTCHAYTGCETPIARCEVTEGQHSWPGTERVIVPCFEEYAFRHRIPKFPTTPKIEDYFRKFTEE